MFNREKFFAYILDLFLKQGGKFTQGQVYRILWEMHKHDLLFHLDDNPKEVGNLQGGIWTPTFSLYEATILNTVVPAFFEKGTLPNFDNDPHEICCQLTLIDEARGWYRVLPRWGFSFDEHEENHYTGFSEPRRWNGWGCPMLRSEDVEEILKEASEEYDWTYRDRGYDVTNKDYPDEVMRLEGEVVMDVDGMKHLVYDMSTLGFYFNVDSCMEANAADWEGFL